ncbi:hypothetical protein M501DRAFT_992738 [Patellaria atrata CBS 101060]|uniref:RNA polymerase I-specific transcription initiation factor RRN6-like protein n=1 Tax=Patellaria atrata CBS 101060 TaxID=1346257 RepID=A0A9P4SBL4_9PEZI|nr:hypothetical protein M501DRAFT_992738 [Patellaria atrata CBS 101060]
MTNPSIHDLKYGHVGPAVYDTDTKEWLFGREISRCNVLKVVGEPEKLLESSVRNSVEQDENNSNKHFSQRIRNALEGLPELLPARHIIEEYAKVSSAMCSAARFYDPANGKLIGFGKAADLDRRSQALVRVIAKPSGESGEILHLAQVFEERRGWGTEKAPALRDFNIDTKGPTYWPGDGSPIKHICFSRPEGNQSAFIAVRTAVSTSILRPLLHRSAIPNRGGSLGQHVYSISRLDANPILKVPITSTGGDFHADVAFNPWYQRQFALVDYRGHWSIWNVEGGQTRGGRTNKYDVKKMKIGILESLVKEQSNIHERPDDGWRRIFWAGNINTIIVCDRKALAVFDIRERPLRLQGPNLHLDTSPDWILDARVDPMQDDRFFVLTSSRIFWIQIDYLGGAEANSGIARILLSWAHFRHPGDISLSIHPFKCGNEIFVLLNSRVDFPIQVFRFTHEDSGLSIPRSLSDPFVLNLESHSDGHIRQKILDLDVEGLSFHFENRFVNKDGVGGRYANEGLQFFSLVSINDDFSISRLLLYRETRVCKFEEKETRPKSVEFPTWSTNIELRRYLSSTFVEDSSDSEPDFIVPDGIADLELIPQHVPITNPLQDHVTSQIKSAGLKSKMQLLNRDYIKNLRDPSTVELSSDIMDVIADIRNEMDSKATLEEDKYYGTLLEFATSALKVEDVDTASSSLEDMIISSGPRDLESRVLYIFRRYAGILLDQPFRVEGNQSLLDIYIHFLHLWLSFLPLNTPNSLRTAKESLCRRFAAECVLSQLELKISEPVNKPEPVESATDIETQTNISQPSSFSLPLRTSGRDNVRGYDELSSQSISTFNDMHSSQGEGLLPTPELTPSVFSGSSFSSSMSGLNDTTFTRMKRRTTLEDTAPFLPTQASRVLMHWNVDSNPDDYDWEATKDAIDDASDTEVDGLSAARRDKLKRRAEKHLKRQRRETASASASIQPTFRSSPGPTLDYGGSSQMATSQPFVASQAERGLFGTRRPPKKKAKVKRQAGFR